MRDNSGGQRGGPAGFPGLRKSLVSFIAGVDVDLAIRGLADRELAVDAAVVFEHHPTHGPGGAVVVAVNQAAFGAALKDARLKDPRRDHEPPGVGTALELDAMIVVQSTAAVPAIGIRLRHDRDRTGPGLAVVSTF